jgi:hypothetical protein
LTPQLKLQRALTPHSLTPEASRIAKLDLAPRALAYCLVRK